MVAIIRHERTNGVITRTSDDVAQTHTDFTTDPPTVIPYSDAEKLAAVRNVAEYTAAQNKKTLLARARAARLANLKFLADTDVTNSEALLQIKALTRQINGIIRVLANELNEVE